MSIKNLLLVQRRIVLVGLCALVAPLLCTVKAEASFEQNAQVWHTNQDDVRELRKRKLSSPFTVFTSHTNQDDLNDPNGQFAKPDPRIEHPGDPSDVDLKPLGDAPMLDQFTIGTPDLDGGLPGFGFEPVVGFGTSPSDASTLTPSIVPAPGAVGILALAALAGRRRRRDG